MGVGGEGEGQYDNFIAVQDIYFCKPSLGLTEYHVLCVEIKMFSLIPNRSS